jgi:hypothetical protein
MSRLMMPRKPELLLSRRRFLRGLGATALTIPMAQALFRDALADVPFTSFGFKATGGNTDRTMPNRLAEVVNVLDYGADPTGVADSHTAFVNAFNAAFTTSGTTHGLANAYLNRPVFIPNGTYTLGSTVTMPANIVGGHIYGAGTGATQITSGLSGSATFKFNGCTNLVWERMTMTCGTRTAGTIAIDLDWDGSAGGDGLHGNVFRDMLLKQVNTCVRIGASGNEGHGNLFQAVTCGDCESGLIAVTASAINNMSVGGGGSLADNGFFPGSTAQIYWSQGGSIHVYEPSVGNNDGGVPRYAVRVDSPFPVNVIGGRAEYETTGTNKNCFLVTNGLVTVRGFTLTGGSNQLLQQDGGKVTLDAIDAPASNNGVVNGNIATGSFTISGTTLTISGGSGTFQVGQVLYGTGIPGTVGGKPSTLSPYIVSGGGTTWTLNYAPGNITGVSGTAGSALYVRGCVNIGVGGYNGSVIENY